MACTEFLYFLVVQGKTIPMTSGKDLVRLFKRLKKREKTQGMVSKIKPVAVAEPHADAKAVEGAVGGAVEIDPVPGVPTTLWVMMALPRLQRAHR